MVHRNDEVTVQQVADLEPDLIIISPGPGDPVDAGISIEVVRQLGPHIPIFGVCLGHQAIAAAFGAPGRARGRADARQVFGDRP